MSLPSRVDHLIYEEVQQVLLAGKSERIDIGGTLVEIDTTDFQKIDQSGLSKSVRAHLE